MPNDYEMLDYDANRRGGPTVIGEPPSGGGGSKAKYIIILLLIVAIAGVCATLGLVVKMYLDKDECSSCTTSVTPSTTPKPSGDDKYEFTASFTDSSMAWDDKLKDKTSPEFLAAAKKYNETLAIASTDMAKDYTNEVDITEFTKVDAKLHYRYSREEVVQNLAAVVTTSTAAATTATTTPSATTTAPVPKVAVHFNVHFTRKSGVDHAAPITSKDLENELNEQPDWSGAIAKEDVLTTTEGPTTTAAATTTEKEGTTVTGTTEKEGTTVTGTTEKEGTTETGTTEKEGTTVTGTTEGGSTVSPGSSTTPAVETGTATSMTTEPTTRNGTTSGVSTPTGTTVTTT